MNEWYNALRRCLGSITKQLQTFLSFAMSLPKKQCIVNRRFFSSRTLRVRMCGHHELRRERTHHESDGLFYSFALVAFILSGSLAHACPDSLFIQGSKQWQTSGSSWSAQSSSGASLPWHEDAVAVLNSAGANLSLNAYSPTLRSLRALGNSSVQSAASEMLLFCSTDTSIIDVAASKNLNLHCSLFAARPLMKSGAGVLQLASSARYLDALQIHEGSVVLSDESGVPASRLLRSSEIYLSTGTSLSYSSTTNTGEIHMGALQGGGQLSLSGSANGLFLAALRDASATTTMSCGAAGWSVQCVGARQVLSGTTSSLGGSLSVYGHSLSDSVVHSSIVLSGSATLSGSIQLRGGALVLSDSTTNISRLGSTSSTSLNVMSGCLVLKAASSGTTQSLGAAGTKAISLNAGVCTLVAESQSSGSGRAQLSLGGPNANFSLRDNTNMVINFVGRGGTLGGAAATDPRITMLGSGVPFSGLGGLLANTATTGTPGFALVNGNSYASWGVNGVKAADFTTVSTVSELQSATSASVLSFQPSGNLSLSANCSAAAVRFVPSVNASLNMGTKNLSCTALMLDGSHDYSMIGSGTIGNATNTRYVHVVQASSILSISNALGSSAAPITKSGAGTLALNASSNQLAFSSANNVNLLQGALRLNASSMGGAGAAGSPNCTINLRGGVLELDGGTSFVRALDQSASSAGGSISFDASTSNKGGGGFAAVNGQSTVNLVTSVGGSTAMNLQWNDGAFVPNGYPLMLNAPRSDSRIILNNTIALDNASTNEYSLREVWVDDNPSSSSDCARLAGQITGSSNADLLKTGPGELELSAENSYAGNTIVREGLLRCTSAHCLPSTTTLVLLGGKVRLDADQAIRDLILEEGTELDLGTATLSLSGTLTNKGGNVVGSGLIVCQGSTCFFVNGDIALPQFKAAGSKPLSLMSDLRISSQLVFDSAMIYTDGGRLLLDTVANVDCLSASSGWCVGEMHRRFNAQHNQAEFRVGDSSVLAEIEIQLNSLGNDGWLSASSFHCETAAAANSNIYAPKAWSTNTGLDSAKLLHRRWRIEADTAINSSWSSWILRVKADSSEWSSETNLSRLGAALHNGTNWVVSDSVRSSGDSILVFGHGDLGELMLGQIVCDKHRIIVQHSQYAHVSPADTLWLDCGANQAYSFSADSCAQISQVYVDGLAQGAISSYNFMNVLQDHVVEVEAPRTTVQPTISLISNHGGDSVCAGETIIFEVLATNGGSVPHYQWLLNGADLGVDAAQLSISDLGLQDDLNQIQCVMSSSAPCAEPITIASQIRTLHVLPLPSSLFHQVDSQTWCPQSQRVFAADQNAQSFSWTIAGAAHALGSLLAATLVLSSDSVRLDSAIVQLETSDAFGCGSSMTKTFVLGDTTAPILECPSNTTLSCLSLVPPAAHSLDEFEAVGGLATDQCSVVWAVDLLDEQSSGSLDSNSYHLDRIYRAIDAAGNSSTAMHSINIYDEIAPQLSVPDSLHWWSGMALDSTVRALCSDNCSGEVEIQWSISGATMLGGTDSPLAETLNAGINDITWIARDKHQNQATAHTIVQIEQSELHIMSDTLITIPADPGACTYTVKDAEFDAWAEGNCPSRILWNSLTNTVTLKAQVFALGTTQVQWRTSDVCGLSASCTMSIHVVDTTAPIIHLRNAVVYLDSSGSALLSTSDLDDGSSDDCASVQLSIAREHFSCADLGVQSCVVKAIDAAGNSSQQFCNVTVRDTLAPKILCRDLVVELDSNGKAQIDVSQVDAGMSDNCSEIIAELSKSEFDCSDIGMQTVVLRAQDLSSNTSSAQFSLSIVDSSAPTLSCPSQLTAYCQNDSRIATLTIPYHIRARCLNNIHAQWHADEQSRQSLSVYDTLLQYTCELGTHHLVFEVENVGGGRSVAECTVRTLDTTAPIARAKNLNLDLDANGHAALSVEQVNSGSSDNCGIAGMSLSRSQFSCSDLGLQNVLLTVRDSAGNSSQALAQVHVRDLRAPVARARNLSINLVNGTATISASQLNNASSDNCGISSYSISKSSFSCADAGTNSVVLTAQDASGNSASAVASVIVNDGPDYGITCSRNDLMYTGHSERHLFLGYNTPSLTLRARPKNTDDESSCASSTHNGSSTTSNSVQYQWTPSSYLSCAHCATPVFCPPSAGHYSYELRTVNAQGCVSLSTLDLCVHDIRVSGQPTRVRLRHGNTLQQLSPRVALAHLICHPSDRLGSDADMSCTLQRGVDASEIVEAGAAEGATDNDISAARDSLTAEDLSMEFYSRPSPFSESCELINLSATESCTIDCVDLAGRRVEEPIVLSAGSTMCVGTLWPAGTYYLQVRRSDATKVYRLLKLP